MNGIYHGDGVGGGDDFDRGGDRRDYSDGRFAMVTMVLMTVVVVVEILMMMLGIPGVRTFRERNVERMCYLSSFNDYVPHLFFSLRTTTVLQSVEPNGELGFTMVWQSRTTPFKMWVEPERIEKYVNFFGPGVDAEVRLADGGGDRGHFVTRRRAFRTFPPPQTRHRYVIVKELTLAAIKAARFGQTVRD